MIFKIATNIDYYYLPTFNLGVYLLNGMGEAIPTYNWVFENQQIASGMLTQLSCYKRVENNLLADEKSPQQGDPGIYCYL